MGFFEAFKRGLDGDETNREATVLICTNCSHIDWFLEAPERI